jgi:hypothetical protein
LRVERPIGVQRQRVGGDDEASLQPASRGGG